MNKILKEENIRLYEDKKMMEAFVGTNSNYFVPIFEEINKNGKLQKMNWAAFFFSDLYLIYRKMYLMAFLSIIAKIIVFEIVELDTRMVVGVMSAVSANVVNILIYLRYVKTVDKIATLTDDYETSLRMMKKYGGENMTGALLMVVIIIFLVLYSQNLSYLG